MVNYMGQNNEYKCIIIPGNPGIKEYYHWFLEELDSQFKLKNIKCCFTIINHLGHSAEKHDRIYSLNDQINHHTEAVLNAMEPNKKLIIIAHSIGCYIVLKLLRNAQINSNVARVFLLFPTVENMSKTPSGAIFTPLSKSKLFLWIIWLLVSIFVIVTSHRFRTRLMKWYFGTDTHSNILEATSILVDPHVVKQVLGMGATEMRQVTELHDWDVIAAAYDRIVIYYGRNDHWCPIEMYHDMHHRFETAGLPTDNVFLDRGDIPHAFVISDSDRMAKFCVSMF